MSRARPHASTPPGRTVRCAGGYAAFVPDPLPTELAWTPTLVRALSDADRLIGRLAGEGGRLPNPHLLIRPFIRDRKSTRLNSSHSQISYAVFCLKKKKKTTRVSSSDVTETS